MMQKEEMRVREELFELLSNERYFGKPEKAAIKEIITAFYNNERITRGCISYNVLAVKEAAKMFKGKPTLFYDFVKLFCTIIRDKWTTHLVAKRTYNALKAIYGEYYAVEHFANNFEEAYAFNILYHEYQEVAETKALVGAHLFVFSQDPIFPVAELLDYCSRCYGKTFSYDGKIYTENLRGNLVRFIKSSPKDKITIIINGFDCPDAKEIYSIIDALKQNKKALHAVFFTRLGYKRDFARSLVEAGYKTSELLKRYY